MLAAHPTEEEQMKRVLATLVALSLVMAMFTGVFTSVPKARADATGMVDLKTAGNYAVFSDAAITTTGVTSITGNIGTSSSESSLAGFGLVKDSSGTFSKSVPSSLVSGNVYAYDDMTPTPADMTAAAGDMYTARQTDIFTRPAATGAFLNIGGGTVGTRTLDPGLYTWGTDVVIPTVANITLDAHGDANAVWVFQISGKLDVMDSAKITLKGGANAANIFWAVAGAVELHPSSQFAGNILASSSIATDGDNTIDGRLLAHAGITLISTTIGLNPGTTPTLPGTITIIKDTVPNGPQDFSFTTTGGLYATVGANVYATTFSLVDDTDADSTHLNTQVFSGVLPGTYTVTEAAAEGYTLDSIVGATSLDLPTGIATIELAAGESATVTFTNNITPTPPVVTPPVVTPPVVTPPVVTPPVVTPTTVYHQTFFIGYPDGTFKPDRNVSRAEVAAALTRALGLGWSDIKPSYPDVPATHWSSGNIQIMKDEGIMIGDVSGTFRPDAFITRAEAATLVLRMLKIAPIQNLVASSFKDVPVTNWAVGYIEAMQKNGLITGYPDGTYKPTVNILRSEFAALANRALGRGIGSSSQTAGLAASVHWPDVPATYWAYLDILEASTPHTVVNAVKLNRTIVLKTKTIPLFSDGASTVTIHKVGDVLTAIVPVDGLLPNGSLPAARQVTVVITIKLKP